MLGTGSIIITHSEGWSCANEAIMGMEFDPMPDKTFKRSLVIDIKGLFHAIGTPIKEVRGVFKHDAGNKTAFKGEMLGKSKIIIKGEVNNDFQTIIKEIEKWQEHYQVS